MRDRAAHRRRRGALVDAHRATRLRSRRGSRARASCSSTTTPTRASSSPRRSRRRARSSARWAARARRSRRSDLAPQRHRVGHRHARGRRVRVHPRGPRARARLRRAHPRRRPHGARAAGRPGARPLGRLPDAPAEAGRSLASWCRPSLRLWLPGRDASYALRVDIALRERDLDLGLAEGLLDREPQSAAHAQVVARHAGSSRRARTTAPSRRSLRGEPRASAWSRTPSVVFADLEQDAPRPGRCRCRMRRRPSTRMRRLVVGRE